VKANFQQEKSTSGIQNFQVAQRNPVTQRGFFYLGNAFGQATGYQTHQHNKAMIEQRFLACYTSA